MSVLKRQKINEKEAGDGPFFKNLIACGNVVVARSRKYFFLQNFFAPRIIFYPFGGHFLWVPRPGFFAANRPRAHFLHQLLSLFLLQRKFSFPWDNCNKWRKLGAVIAQWIRLRLPSCRPGFEFQAHFNVFFNLDGSNGIIICHLNCYVNKTKINKKEDGIDPFF